MTEEEKKELLAGLDDIMPAMEVGTKAGVPYWLSTGYPPLDRAISGKLVGGGIPAGRITVISGLQSSGKTMVATKIGIATQQIGGMFCYLDAEHAFDQSFAEKLGLSGDQSLWRHSAPDTAEETFQIILDICEWKIAKKVDIPITFVVDSISALVTDEEDDVDVKGSNMKTKLSLASFMSSTLKKVARDAEKAGVTVVLLSQIREKPNVTFGNNKTTSGGTAPKFYASVMVETTKKGRVKEGDDVIGELIEVEVTKNKVNRPFEKCTYITGWNVGINLPYSYLDYLKEYGLIQQKGAWYSFGDRKFNGKKQLYQECLKDPTILEEMEEMFKVVQEIIDNKE